MDNYSLIVLFALFLGVMGIIAILEYRRRNDLLRFESIHQTLAACLEALQHFKSKSEEQGIQQITALAQIRDAIESAQGLSGHLAHTLEQSVTRLELAIQQAQKAHDATLVRTAESLSESASARFKEIVAESRRTNQAVHDLSETSTATAKELVAETRRMIQAVNDLKASMEESVKF
jgi:hypothetical protein